MALAEQHDSTAATKWATKWCFTINAADDDPEGENLQQSIVDLNTLFDNGDVVYTVGSWERGTETNRLHIQGWLKLNRTRIGRWLIDRVYRISIGAQWARNDAIAIAYADNPDKEGYISKAFELGEKPSSKAGKRTDIDQVNEEIASGRLKSYRDVSDFNPGIAARNAQWVNWRLEEQAIDIINGRPSRHPSEYREFVWQHWLRRYLTELPPDERKVITIQDALGHAGKTRFITEFRRAHPNLTCQCLGAGKVADLSQAINVLNDVLFIDIERSKAEHIEYLWSWLEKVKGGSVFAQKWLSREKQIAPCHVVVFMNEEIEYGQTLVEEKYWHAAREKWMMTESYKKPVFTHDRYCIWNICPGHLERWTGDGHRWQLECPPFLSFDEEFRKIPYHPPFVPTSGPQFNGDVAGDGPRTQPFNPQWPTPAYRSRKVRAGTACQLREWWCMRTGKYVSRDQVLPKYVYWQFSRKSRWYKYLITPWQIMEREPPYRTVVAPAESLDWEAKMPPQFLVDCKVGKHVRGI